MRVEGPIVPAMILLLVVGTAGTVSRVNSGSTLVERAGQPGIVYNGPYSGRGRLGPPYARRPATGPLKVCPENPRYFCNPAGEAVYLTGSHNWNNLKDGGEYDPPPVFDFANYLDFLVSHNHNFIRLWNWELTKSENHYSGPFPWVRTGPGMALDGKLRFDLHRFNQAYFDRLRARVIAAGNRGIYVSVMLFEGWGLQEWRWDGHPFNASNNINGVDGDINHDGRGTEVDTLLGPTVTRIQETYVRKVIDSVNDLDNVLYEIANEAGPYSTAWQYHMIRYVKAIEASKPKQHPVGMTFQWNGGLNGALFSSPADWISPGRETSSYRTDPPPAAGNKVILVDTDHLWGIGGDSDWVWKSFTRGLNPLYMDDLQPVESREKVRLAMGHALAYANRMDLLKMVPHGELASSGYCLAQPGVEYLAYAPEGGAVVMQLGETSVDFRVEWFSPKSGEVYEGGMVRGWHLVAFRAPFSGPTLLYLRSN
jgi:hypothetical protein